jgi:hypothetical protein
MSTVANTRRADYNRPNIQLSSVRRPVANAVQDGALEYIVQTATAARTATTEAAYQLRIKHLKKYVKQL